jgi:hypothetical protein
MDRWRHWKGILIFYVADVKLHQTVKWYHFHHFCWFIVHPSLQCCPLSARMCTTQECRRSYHKLWSFLVSPFGVWTTAVTSSSDGRSSWAKSGNKTCCQHQKKLYSVSLTLLLDKLVRHGKLYSVLLMLLLDKLVHHKSIYCVNDAIAG